MCRAHYYDPRGIMNVIFCAEHRLVLFFSIFITGALQNKTRAHRIRGELRMYMIVNPTAYYVVIRQYGLF